MPELSRTRISGTITPLQNGGWAASLLAAFFTAFLRAGGIFNNCDSRSWTMNGDVVLTGVLSVLAGVALVVDTVVGVAVYRAFRD